MKRFCSAAHVCFPWPFLPTELGEAFQIQGRQSRLDLEGCHLRQYTAFLLPGLQGIYTAADWLGA